MGKIRISIGNDFFFFAVLRMLPAFGSQVFIQEICQFPDTSEIYVAGYGHIAVVLQQKRKLAADVFHLPLVFP